MVPSLAAHPFVRITACADPRPEARERFSADFGADAYANAEELCAAGNVDAVYIATPHQFHAEHTIMAADCGKHVIVEKPMALTLDACRTMIDAVDHAGVRLVVGHTHSFDPPILRMRQIIHSGKLGAVKMVNSWDYTNFLYRPRRPEELDTSLGGGIIFNQVPHQIDTVRLLAGGLVRSVRSATGIWDVQRPTEGAHATFLDFEDGAVATVSYSGYDHFDSDELYDWVGEGGSAKNPGGQAAARRELAAMAGQDEASLKAATGFGGARQRHRGDRAQDPSRHHPHFGLTIVSCERGDLRSAPDGVLIYGDEEQRFEPVPLGRTVPDKGRVVDELYDAVVQDKRPAHDGAWGRATLEVCLAILQSARERREIALSHQVPFRDE